MSNTAIDKEIERAEINAYNTGHFPKVQWGMGGGFKSYSLFERQEVSKLFILAAHYYLIGIGIPEGVFTKKRSNALLVSLACALSSKIYTYKDIYLGQMVKLKEVRGISPRYRTCTVDYLPDESFIMEGNNFEQDGYYAEHGSYYSYELRLAQDVEGIWHVVEQTPEELAWEIEVNNAMSGAVIAKD